MLADYIMKKQKNINAPKADANIPSGVIGKPFVCGAYILNNERN